MILTKRSALLSALLGLGASPVLAKPSVDADAAPKTYPQGPRWTEPRAVWTSIPGIAADPHWSEDYYAVAQGAIMPRMVVGPETPEEAARRDRAWEVAIRTYLRRVSCTMGAMNHPDEAARARYRDKLAPMLAETFVHTEGRGKRDGKGGFVYRTKPQLMKAAESEAFKLTGFFAFGISAWVGPDDEVCVVEAVYIHNQFNDETVERTDALLMTGLPVRPRTANETMTVGTRVDHGVIWKHWAIDAEPSIALPGGGGSRI